ncbi:MAG: hypothetical protein WCI31_00625 [Prolixibacteraceae bacterium]
MKILSLLLTFCLFTFIVNAQRGKVELSHYIFPEFTKGTVLMKSGTVNPTSLNYNALTEEMIFNSNGKNLAMTRLEEIDTVYIEKRKFFLVNNKFVELLYRNKYDLYIAHKCSVVEPGKPAAYGGTSQTSSTTSYSSILSGGQAYELSLPEGYTTKPYFEYWLKKDGKLTLIINMRQLAKQFDDKSDQFKKFVKENKVKYDDQEGILSLVKFMEGQ